MTDASPGYRVRPLSAEEGDAVAGWRYREELSTYDGNGEGVHAADGYWAVVDGAGTFVGYCCFGVEARVPGVEEEDGVLDVGVGMAPEYVAQGRSREFTQAVLEFATERFAPERFRALVLEWNSRSLATSRNAGFAEVARHEHDGRTFVILERPA